MRFKLLLAAATISTLFAASPVFAQQQPAEPTTIELPANVVLAMRQYLGTRPYDEAAQLIGAIQDCVRVQSPQNGMTTSHGECAPVTAAREAHAAATAKAVADATAKAKSDAAAAAATPGGNKP